MAIATTVTDMHLRSSQAMGLLATSPHSITSWIKATWNLPGANSFIGIYGPSSDTPLGSPVTALQIGSRTSASDINCWTWGGRIIVQTTGSVMTAYNNVWCQIAYTYDGTTNRLYRNGVELASSTTTHDVGYLNQVYINGYPGGDSSEVASFETDQYTLYRRALSADEVLTIYNAGGARHGISHGLVCRYEFDELASDSNVVFVPDFAGNGHNLTTIGAGTNFKYTYNNVYPNSNIRVVQ